MDRGKLGIALPKFNGRIDLDFFDSWTLLEKPDFTYLRPPFYAPIDKIRNLLAKRALEEDCDYLLMLDTDQIFSTNMVERLWNDFWAVPKYRHVNEQSVDINPPGAVSGKIYRRYPPFDPLMFFIEEDMQGTPKYRGPSYEEQHGEGLLEVDATGTGCVMFRCEVFKKIEYPWFVQDKYHDSPGEDIYFCNKLRSAGYSIWIDRSVDVPQSAKIVVNQALHDVHNKIMRSKENDTSSHS